MWMLKIALGLAVMGGSAYAAVWLYHSPAGRAWQRLAVRIESAAEGNRLFTVIVPATVLLWGVIVVGYVLWAAYAIGGIIL